MKLISEKGSPLLSVGILVALLLAAIFIVFFLKPFEKREKGVIVSPGMPITVTAIPTKETSSNIPPLWPGVEWGKPIEGEYLFINKSGEIITMNGYRTESKLIANTDSFFRQFIDELKSKGWEETDYASGPDGDVYSLENDLKFLTVGSRSVSENKGPSRDIKGYTLFIEQSIK